MATLTITIPDPQLDRVLDALAIKFGYNPNSGITKAEFVRTSIIEFMKREVKRQERHAYDELFTYQPPDIT